MKMKKLLSALCAGAILIGNSPIGQMNVYAESAPETEVTVPETEETAPEQEETTPEQEEPAPEQEDPALELDETAPELEEPEDFPQFNDSSEEESLIEAYAASAAYNPTASVAYAHAHWDDGKGLCAEFVSDCLKAGGVSSPWSVSCGTLINNLINGGYGTKYTLSCTSKAVSMTNNTGKLSEGDPVFYYCNSCNVYPHVVLCTGSSGGYAIASGHNAAMNDNKIWNYFTSGTHVGHTMTMYSIHMNKGIDPFTYTELADGTLEVECNDSTITNAVIPETVNGKKVSVIGNSAFSSCTSLKSVTIPNSVTTINDYAFQNCTSLTSITIPNSVTSIGWTSFAGCTNLTSITIPNSVTSIGGYAFFNCKSLTSITIPSSVTEIGTVAFYNCTSLTSVTISNGVTSISGSAFSGCTSIKSITIPNSVTSIGSSAFSGCTSLTSVTIPNGVTSIDTATFSSCTSLKSVTIPDSVLSIGCVAFEGCKSLTSITIPNSVASILDFAFSGCASLTSITIPSGVGEGAFCDCSNLTSVTILGSNTYFYEDDADYIPVFRGCANFTIYGLTGSTAEAYAKKHGNPFVALDAPDLPAIKATAGDKQVALSWNAVSGATKYRAFTYLNGKYTQVGETTSTSFAVKNLTNGTKYGFLVLAYNGSTWSNYTVNDVKYATPTGLVKPDFTVTPGKNQAMVSWNKVSGATKYRVFTYLNGKFTQIGETTSTSYAVMALSGGTEYGFLVLAYNGTAWSPYSTRIDVKYATPTGLVKPDFTVTPGKNQAMVSWNKVSGATKYRIFTYLNGKFTQIGETTSTSYAVMALSGGTEYGFLVLAYNGSAWSPYSTRIDVKYATPTGLVKPAFTVTPGIKQATVKWNAVSGAKKYRVFTYLNGKFTQVGETTSTSFTVKNLAGGTKYGFLVLAYNGSAWSPYSTRIDVLYATVK